MVLLSSLSTSKWCDVVTRESASSSRGLSKAPKNANTRVHNGRFAPHLHGIGRALTLVVADKPSHTGHWVQTDGGSAMIITTFGLRRSTWYGHDEE